MVDFPRLNYTPDERVYNHRRCDTGTVASGGHFSHICNPFRTCTGTFCATCGDYFPLREVDWDDTGENVDAFRDRIEKATPDMIRYWRYGLGLLVGAIVGMPAGALIHFAMAPRNLNMLGAVAVGAAVGAAGAYFLGIPILHRVYDFDYRRFI